jgi:iron complex transport system permease protein
MVFERVTAGRVWTTSLLALAVMVAAAGILPLIGSAHIDYGRAFAGQSPDNEILFVFRLPRVLLAMLTGGSLAVAGVLFQALLRETLATPYTLGVSSGASLGAVLSICLGWNQVWVASLIGAGVTLLLVMAVASESRRMSSFTLLMAGITLNSICMALILFFQNFASFGQSFAIVRWLMGGIEPVPYSTLAWLTMAVLPTVFYLFWKAREWNLLAVGEEWAATRGVSTSSLILAGYLIGSFLTGTVTALTGPIGFVGLIVPHALRLTIGADHRLLIPASFFLGATFLAICETIARTILAPAEIPVGVITAVLGGPFFIWMLRSRSKSS